MSSGTAHRCDIEVGVVVDIAFDRWTQFQSWPAHADGVVEARRLGVDMNSFTQVADSVALPADSPRAGRAQHDEPSPPTQQENTS